MLSLCACPAGAIAPTGTNVVANTFCLSPFVIGNSPVGWNVSGPEVKGKGRRTFPQAVGDEYNCFSNLCTQVDYQLCQFYPQYIDKTILPRTSSHLILRQQEGIRINDFSGYYFLEKSLILKTATDCKRYHMKTQ